MCKVNNALDRASSSRLDKCNAQIKWIMDNYMKKINHPCAEVIWKRAALFFKFKPESTCVRLHAVMLKVNNMLIPIR